MLAKLLLIFCVNYYVKCVPPSPTSAVTDMLQLEFANMKNTIKILSDQWEKWNTLFLTSLEPRISSISSTLASIDSNIHNIQERAHVWDTFQLHVSAWNDQLAALDRKIDILNKGQEKVFFLEGKLNSIVNMELKLDNAIRLVNNVYDTVSNLDTNVNTKKTEDTLLSEFATRGVLSSIKTVERKLDRLLIANQNSIIKTKGTEEKPKLTIKCNTPRQVEDLLNDISAKVDVIFDNVSNINEEDDNEYDNDYVEVKNSNSDDQQTKNKRLKKAIKRVLTPCKQMNQALEEILNRAIRIENTSMVLLDKEDIHFERLSAESQSCDSRVIESIRSYSSNIVKSSNRILDGYFVEQRTQLKSILNKLNDNCSVPKLGVSNHRFLQSSPTPFGIGTTEKSTSTTANIPTSSANNIETKTAQPTWIPIVNQNKSSCEDLEGYSVSGVYIFENNQEDNNSELFFNKRYCEIRSDGVWTVVQRRDNYDLQHNFNASWEDYKYGFGDLHRDFWMGNDFLHKTSNVQDLILRVELEDFENNSVWAEYDRFYVSSEQDNYRITVGGYIGNASDSLSGHNGSYFSTYDKKNDLAPTCCPCAVSYGGGWWFSSCFESNLNGVYYKKPNENNYFRGIIWEHWLGNYSLKRSVMMVKPKRRIQYETVMKPRTTETVGQLRKLGYRQNPFSY